MSPHLFALACTADLGAERLNAFLEITYRTSKKLDCQPSLLLVDTSFADIQEDKEPTLAAPTNIPVVKDSLERIAQSLKAATDQGSRPAAIDSRLFVVLDERSIVQDDGLIVNAKDDGSVDSIRVHFDTINAELIRVNIMTFTLDDSKLLAREQADGVLRLKPQKESERGGPAPRKRLGW